MRVRIFKPAKNALQSRCPCGGQWLIEPVGLGVRTVHPVTGWVSADDGLSSLTGRLAFATSGEALTFARAKGWDFELEMPQERRTPPKSYLDNFNPDRRRSGR